MKTYRRMIINSYERFTQNLWWRIIHILKPKETYEFKSTKTPPPVPDLKEFEDALDYQKH